MVLNDVLKEASRRPSWKDLNLKEYLKEENIVALILRDSYGQSLLRFDLHTGKVTETVQDVPVYMKAVLPNGRFLGINDRGNRMTVFSPAGTLISRHSLEWAVTRVHCNGDRVLILESHATDMGFVSGAFFGASFSTSSGSTRERQFI